VPRSLRERFAKTLSYGPGADLWSKALRRCLTLILFATALVMSGCGASSSNTVVLMDTSMGPIKVELFDDSAPITVKNFLKYVDDKHYDGTIFHRVIPNFMIQGGGFDVNMKEKLPGAIRIKNESYNGKQNKRGTLAMARTPEPDSATDQFFINTVDNDFLDKAKAQDRVGYCVFGKVIDGMEVVDKIRNVKTTTKQGQEDVPVEPVVIKSIRRVGS
jgi:peptidyl-prolyl cis-trans isomerase B (cyclophilin B)